MNGSSSADFERLYALGTGFQTAEIIFTAVRLGIFSVLDAGPATGKSLAAKIKSLAGCSGQVHARVEKPGPDSGAKRIIPKTPLSRRLLGEDAGQGCEDILIHLETLKSSWAHLACSLEKGTMQPPQKKALADYPRQLKRFLAAMHASGAVKSTAICEGVAAAEIFPHA